LSIDGFKFVLSMIRSGENIVDGVVVEVRRKRIRRINIRIGDDGRVHLSVPIWWATLAEGEAFLRSKWDWVLKARAEIINSPPAAIMPVGESELENLAATIGGLMEFWSKRLDEGCVGWKLRAMKTLWGSCNFRRRQITYSHALARASREQVEYVVVHELTHLKAHDHGAEFQALMNERLPEWKTLRKSLNRSSPR
jgi:predicted metal-dependent hydrolase